MRQPHARVFALAALLLLLGTACGVYTLGGPGHGARFVVPPGVLQTPDPVVQTWVSYSLAKSFCQLEHGGEHPSRHDSFECEWRPRTVLVKRWLEGVGAADAAPVAATRDAYLDLLVRVEDAGFLAEYVWVYLGRRGWVHPDGLRLDAFDAWQAEPLRFHRPQTRIIGWWTEQ